MAIIDSHSTNDLADGNTAQGVGIIGYARTFTYGDTIGDANNRTAALEAPTSGLTISVWVKTLAEQSQTVIANMGFDSGNQYGYRIYMSAAGRVGGEVGNGSYSTAETAASYNDGEWTHIVLTYDGASTKLYVNNVLEDTDGGCTGNIAYHASCRFLIGAHYNTGVAGWFTGDIDEVGVWSRALDADEVAQLWGVGSGLVYESFT